MLFVKCKNSGFFWVQMFELHLPGRQPKGFFTSDDSWYEMKKCTDDVY